jgi:hypothetical protein
MKQNTFAIRKIEEGTDFERWEIDIVSPTGDIIYSEFAAVLNARREDLCVKFRGMSGIYTLKEVISLIEKEREKIGLKFPR